MSFKLQLASITLLALAAGPGLTVAATFPNYQDIDARSAIVRVGKQIVEGIPGELPRIVGMVNGATQATMKNMARPPAHAHPKADLPEASPEEKEKVHKALKGEGSKKGSGSIQRKHSKSKPAKGRGLERKGSSSSSLKKSSGKKKRDLVEVLANYLEARALMEYELDLLD